MSSFGQPLQFLLKKNANVNQQDEEGDTPLIISIKANSIRIAQHLVKSCKDLDVNIQNKQGLSALMLAASAGSKKLIKNLIELHADVTQKDEQGKTAFDYALDKGSQELLHGKTPETPVAEEKENKEEDDLDS